MHSIKQATAKIFKLLQQKYKIYFLNLIFIKEAPKNWIAVSTKILSTWIKFRNVSWSSKQNDF